MALWLVRAGSHGEYEKKFLAEGRIYLTWDDLSHDLGKLTQKADLRALLEKVYPESSKGQISNYTGQIRAFADAIGVRSSSAPCLALN